MRFNDWYNLKTTLQSSLKLMSHILGQIEELKSEASLIFCENLSQEIFQKLSQLNSFLDTYLEFSLKEGEITIRAGIVEELDELLKIYENLDEILDYFTGQELNRLQQHNSQFQSQMMLQYFPQLGFFITIEKQESQNQIHLTKLTQMNPQEQLISSPQDVKQSTNKYCQEKQINVFYAAAGQVDQENSQKFSIDCQIFKKLDNQYELYSPLEENGRLNQNKIQNEIEKQFTEDRFQNNQEIDNSSLIKQYDLLEDYSFCFTLNDALLFKNNLCIDLDEKYGDIQSRIIDIQREILREIEQQIILCDQELIHSNQFIGDLDLYLCLYQAAEAYNLRKPILVQDSSLICFEMRNILTELTVGEKQYITNNFCVYNFSDSQFDRNIATKNILDNEYSNRFTIITGPNYSGKSVLLKSHSKLQQYDEIPFNYFKDYFTKRQNFNQILCDQNRQGCFVPCRFARIGMVDAIYVTTPQHDSVLKFSGETAQQFQTINHILHQATNKSLILIDELGKNLRLSDSLKINQSLIKCLTEDDFSQNPQIRHQCQNNRQNSMLNENDYPIYYEFQNQNNSPGHTFFNEDSLGESSYENRIQFNQEKSIFYLKQQFNKIPITLMATHLNQLLTISDLRENYLIRFTHMEVLIEEGRNVYKASELQKDLNSLHKIVHVYRLKQGPSLKSCAALVAKNIVGNNESFISRIFEISKQVSKGELKQIPRQCLELIHLKKVQKIVEFLEESNENN